MPAASSSTSAGWIDASRSAGDDEPEDPPEVAEQRLEQVVERERLVAQHGEAVEVVGALLVLDRRHGRLQPGDVRLHGDRQAVAEPPLTGAG